MPVQFRFQSFEEANRYFRQKINVPTATWRDLWQGEHARAFTVAGALRDDLLADLRTAVDAAITQGESLEKFRKRFDEIVARHGWAYNGGRGWRTRVIYSTNVRTAYMAGRYRQMTEPSVLRHMPYWQYRHHTLLNPREEHKAWNGLVLRHDDPFWRTHYPPNGWGCRCDVRPLSERQLRKLGKTGPDPSPGANAGHVPPEWSYNVGEAYHGRPPGPLQNVDALDAAEPRLTSMGWLDQGRPSTIPMQAMASGLLSGIASAADLAAVLTQRWGAPRRSFEFGEGASQRSVVADAPYLARHLGPDRWALGALVEDVLSDPYEVYVAFVRQRNGRIALRYRLIRGFLDTRSDRSRALLLVADAQDGQMVAYTMYPRTSAASINRLRSGWLVYARDRSVGDEVSDGAVPPSAPGRG